MTPPEWVELLLVHIHTCPQESQDEAGFKWFIDTDQGCDGDEVQKRNVCFKALLDVPERAAVLYGELGLKDLHLQSNSTPRAPTHRKTSLISKDEGSYQDLYHKPRPPTWSTPAQQRPIQDQQ